MLLVAALSEVAVAVVVAELLGRTNFDIADELGSLLAAGVGTCGASVVVGVEGSV